MSAYDSSRYSMQPLEERKKLSSGFLPEGAGSSESAAPDMSAAKMAAASQLLSAGQKSGAFGESGGAGDIASQAGQGALAGAAFGAPGAAVGAAAGLTVGLLGAAASQKERQRQAAAQYYSDISQIEGQKSARIQAAIQNMGQGIGSTLLSNQKVSL